MDKFTSHIMNKFDMKLVTDHQIDRYRIIKFHKDIDIDLSTEESIDEQIKLLGAVKEFAEMNIVHTIDYDINPKGHSLTLTLTNSGISDAKLKYMKKLNIN